MSTDGDNIDELLKSLDRIDGHIGEIKRLTGSTPDPVPTPEPPSLLRRLLSF